MIYASEIASSLSSSLCGEDMVVTGVCSLQHPKQNSLAFCTSQHYLNNLVNFPQLLLITDIIPDNYKESRLTFIKYSQPRYGWTVTAVRYFYPAEKPFISNTAQIGNNVSLGKDVSVGEYSIIHEDVVVGDKTRIGNHVVIHRNTKIGCNCVIKSGAIIGSEGFGFASCPEGFRLRLPHFGNVVLKNFVEIGANTSICRGTIDDTIIGNHTKIADLVLIAHNAIIGDHVVICDNTCICGSTKIEDCVYIAPNSVINDVTLHKNCFLNSGSVVLNDVQAGVIVSPLPSRAIDRQWKFYKKFGVFK